MPRAFFFFFFLNRIEMQSTDKHFLPTHSSGLTTHQTGSGTKTVMFGLWYEESPGSLVKRTESPGSEISINWVRLQVTLR